MDYLQLRTHKTGLYVGLIVFFALAFHVNLLVADSTPTTPAMMSSPAVTKTRQQDNFYFDPAPRNQDVVEGAKVILRCDVSNRRHITFYWTLGSDDKRLPNTSRRFQEDSDLHIVRVSRQEDAGSFRCVATNVTTGVSRISTEAQLNILWISKTAEVQLKHPKEVSGVAEGADLTLKCHAEGNPELHFEWYKNKIRLFSTERLKFPRSRLKLTGVSAVDNGVYSCKAKNNAGQIISADNFLLNVPGMQAAHLDLSAFTKVLLVKEGGVANLHCYYDNAIATDWYFHERKLTNTTNNRVTVYANGSLVLNPVRQEDKGIYRCDGISQSGPGQTFTSELVLAYLNPLKVNSFEPKPPRNQPKVLPVDQQYEVRCITPKGLPAPRLQWEDPRGVVILATGDRVSASEGLLRISGAQPSDSGNYTCVVHNMAGEQRQAVWLVISVPPVISEPPQSTRVEEEGTAEFNCKVRGTPYPVSVVTWSKDDIPLALSQSRFVTDLRLGTLRIYKVRLSDEGNYACVVNTTGHPPVISTNAHLYIKKKLKFRPPPVNRKLELSSVTRIHCKAEGQSEPAIHWLKNGKPELPDHVDDAQGTLVFNKVARTDAGTYTCVASNSQGIINKTISVEVVVKPQFKVRPVNTTAYEGYPVMLHCVAIGEPKPTIQWDNSKSRIDPRRFKVLSNGSLYVSEVYIEDTGIYGCTAGNTGGLKRTEVYLHVANAEMYGRLTPGALPVENFNMMRTIVIAVCCAVAYLAVVIGLTVYCSIRLIRAKNLRKQEDEPCAENGAVPTERTELMDKKERDSSIMKSDDTRSHASGVSSHPSHSSHSSRRLGYDKLSFPRHDLQTLRVLGKGHYGDVFLAKAHGICDGEIETLVVVKSLLTRDEQYVGEFRREVDMLSKLNHAHIVRLLGICREMEPHFLITEYSEWGDLKQFLWAMRKDNSNRNVNLPPLTLAQKTTMCSQMAQALEFLGNQHFVHRDVATRNVLLSSHLDLKLSTLCLCRDIYATEYYPFHQRLVPLRWMPPEAVLEGNYSNRSDVWSYGVYVWEVFTLADLPYAHQADDDVLTALQRSERMTLPLPSDCPLEVTQLVHRCMATDPADRPSFGEITAIIGQMTVDSDV